MGGRGGSSQGKAGGGTVAQAVASNPTPPPTPTKTVEAGSLSKFMSLDDNGKADMITALTKQSVPVFLADNDFQKLTYSIGGNDKPQIVADNLLDKTKGIELFRTVNGVKDTKHGITYDADMIASQIQRGSVTRVSDSGGSAYGRGIYFADNYSDSITYGRSRTNIKTTAVVRAKIDPNAKIISHRNAMQQLQAEMNSGSKLGKALAKCDSHSRVSIYALSKGYSAIQSGTYFNVLSRKALVISSDIKAGSTKWK